MIVGIGVDLVDIERVNRIYARFGLRFLERILTRTEQAAAPAGVAPWLAARFAAKEATVKALGTGFARGIVPAHIEVTKDSLGQPHLLLHGAALRRAEILGVSSSHISLTHERHCALAMVILEA